MFSTQMTTEPQVCQENLVFWGNEQHRDYHAIMPELDGLTVTCLLEL
jgi:hypothetical protein